MAEDAGLVNVYVCTHCGGKIVTKNRDEGTTPFMMQCRATFGCKGAMQSSFYRVRQDQPPTILFIMPTPAELAAYNALHPGHERGILEHVANGGLLDVDVVQ